MAAPATVAEISEADIPEVADFLARQVRAEEASTANPLSPVDRLRWLLLQNPARAADIPLGWCIRGESGEIVGAAICSPFNIGVRDFRATALMFSKFFVDPPYRGMGLGLLMRFVRLGEKFPLFVTSTNAVAGQLFARVGAQQIAGLDHTMLAVNRLRPVAEEFFYRHVSKYQNGNRRRSLRYSEEPDRTAENPALRSTSETGVAILSQSFKWLPQLLAWPLWIVDQLPRASIRHTGSCELLPIQDADQVAALNLPPSGDRLAVIRDRDYVHWRYFTGERDKDIFCFRCPGEIDRLVVINQLRSGYRRQIRVLNVLDIWPATTPASAMPLIATLQRQYSGQFDALWLRSQPAEVETSLRANGMIRHDFPAPLGWYIDRQKRLPTNACYLMPGESE